MDYSESDKVHNALMNLRIYPMKRIMVYRDVFYACPMLKHVTYGIKRNELPTEAHNQSSA